MKRARSSIVIFVTILLLLPALTVGCDWIDNSERDIISTVQAYLEEYRSGTFAENRYLSSYAKDAPFSSIDFKDDAAMDCMNASFRQIRCEVLEASGRKKEGTGLCTVRLTLVDVDKILKTIKDTWITDDDLNRGITSAEAPTCEEEVILFMEYNPAGDAWIISDSASMAVAVGVPYSNINLFSEAGPPEEAFAQFMEALASGEAEKIEPFIKTYSSYGALYPEGSEISVRQAFFGQIDYEIADFYAFGDSCEMKVFLDYPDMQGIANRVYQDPELLCEIFKYLFTAYLSSGPNVSTDAFTAMETQLWISDINDPDTGRLQETFVFSMIPGEEGTQWRIKELPSFMSAVYVSTEEIGDEVSYAAAGTALVELCEEGVITEQQRDEGLANIGLPDT